MKLTDKLKKEIDGMSYESMLSKWRFAPIGAPIFQDESGVYFTEAMKLKRDSTPHEEQVAASKSLGWEK